MLSMRKKLAAAVLTAGALVAAPAVTAEAAPPTVRSGMLISVDETIITESNCTLGAVLSASRAITAGHCGNVGAAVRNKQGVRIGTISANRMTKGLDIATIRLARGVRVQLDRVNWSVKFHKGQVLSKSGITTGFGRGVVTNPKPIMRTAQGWTLAPPFLLRHATVSIQTNLRSQSGDSGSGVRDASGRIVGILSAGGGNKTLVAPVSYLPGHLR